MAGEACKIFVVDRDTDLLDLIKITVGEERHCEVEATLAGEGDFENFLRIKAFLPDLVILDFLYPDEGTAWCLLHRLRSDPATGSIPILAVSTPEEIVEHSLVFYNVGKVLTKPIDTASLRTSVSYLLNQPKLARAACVVRAIETAEQVAAKTLEEKTQEIVDLWLKQISSVQPLARRAGASPGRVIDHLPVLLWGTVVALRAADSGGIFGQSGAYQAAVVRCAQAVQGQGVPLEAFVRELALLRNCIWEALREKALGARWTADDLFRIGKIIFEVLDEAVITAVSTYQKVESTKAA